jgi:hypothetical protein
MKRLSSRAAALSTAWLLSCAMPVEAYELQTHQQITARAFDEAFRVSQDNGLQSYLIAVGIAPDDDLRVTRPTTRPSRSRSRS